LGSDFWVRLLTGLAALGPRRLVALALAGFLVFSAVAMSSYLLSQPTREILYTGLDVQDISQIGAALEEAGIAFDVNAEGTAMLVDHGKTAQARMILAEKGLPKGDKSGYELFDNMGSLGLTSFMQQITKIRALEGELARTIQLIKGIKAARVHVVMPQEGSFRSLREPPSASVVIRAEFNDGKTYAPAIQQLVAAAIPGMTRDMVSVMSTDGAVLASTGKSETAGAETMVGLERELASDIERRIGQTLAPSLGAENFRISVAAKLNTDRRQISETVFDPESRVERSVRSVKELGETQNRAGSSVTGVEQNIPSEVTPSAASGDQSAEKNDKREELTNYEINSKQVQTKSEGYSIENISVAVVINKQQLVKMLGGTPTPEQISQQLQEFQQLAASAAGTLEKRGDQLRITAVDFLAADQQIEAAAGEGIMSIITGNLGTLINAITLIVIIVLIFVMGLRPALRAILESPGAGMQALPGSDPRLPGLDGSGMDMVPAPLIAEFSEPTPPSLQNRLEEVVQQDNAKAARILKEWLAEPAKGAA
jgi:flagellar M-ring protein FliF